MRILMSILCCLSSSVTNGVDLSPQDRVVGKFVITCKGEGIDIDNALMSTLSKQISSKAEVQLNLAEIKGTPSESADGLLLQLKKMECVQQYFSTHPGDSLAKIKSGLEGMLAEQDQLCSDLRKDRARKSKVPVFDVMEISACRQTLNLSLLLGALNSYDPKSSNEETQSRIENFIAYQREVRKKEQSLFKSPSVPAPGAK